MRVVIVRRTPCLVSPLVNLVERQFGLTLMQRVPNKTVQVVGDVLIEVLCPLKAGAYDYGR